MHEQPSIVIEQLTVYPVKSLAGIALSTTELSSKGLKGDREWMIINEKNGFISQRKIPSLSQIKTKFDAAGVLNLSSDTTGNIELPNIDQGSIERVKVWSDYCEAFAAPGFVNAWLRDTLKTTQKVRLVKFNKNVARASNENRFGLNSTTHFADAAPFLIANSASLDALNTSLRDKNKPLATMAQFRPNIVIKGPKAFAEHHISTIAARNKSIRFSLHDHCQRCIMITIDPTTGLHYPNNSPFDTLAEINSMPKNPKAPAFGVNATLTDHSDAPISIGDQFNMLK